MSTALENNRKTSTTFTWIAIAVISLVWWGIAGQNSWWRFVLVVGLSLASFMVGCLVGFLFTSYGEETNTVGKVRDWLIGGITGLTVAKAGALKGLLLTFAAGPGPSEFALTVSAAVVYAALGFFFMFFQRELIFNVLLAASRAERGRLEGTQQAGHVTQRLLQALPASLLSGIDDVDDTVDKAEADKLRALVYSPDVQKFLDDAEEAAKTGGTVDWDIASKTAVLHYYRTYFEKDDKKIAQAELASQWIQRALIINPLHVDLTVKYADVLAMMDRYDEAVAILEKLERTPDAPAYVKQWLGYFLLFLPDRLGDAIRYSQEYHKLFPTETDSFFNVAYAYGRKYCDELRAAGKTADAQSANRAQALANLKEGLESQPDYAETVRTKSTQKGKGYECLLHDKDFRTLVGLPPETTSNPSGAAGGS
jgi:tetratricopeptide (TPR) repeat protein